MNNVKGYIFSRPFMGENAPQQVQNMVIRDFCSKNNLKYFLSEAEYSMPNCFYGLKGLLDDIKSMQGIVLYSLFQLPEDNDERKKIYNKSIEKKIILYFAIEGKILENYDDILLIENIFNIKKCLMQKDLIWEYK